MRGDVGSSLLRVSQDATNMSDNDAPQLSHHLLVPHYILVRLNFQYTAKLILTSHASGY